MLVISLFFSVTTFAQVDFVGHRGASYLAPENTVSSAKLAWELGADAVEIDVYLTKDNKVMLSHDASTKRTSGVDLKIAETKSSVLRKLDVGYWKDEKYKGEKIPFIKKILNIIPEGRVLVVEIKTGSEILPALKKAIDKSGKMKQVTFIAFGWETILETKKLFPDNLCYWLSSEKNGLFEKMEQCKEKGLDGVDLQSKIVDKSVMDKASQLGLDVLVWTVNDPVEARMLANLGVVSITTDRPGWLREQMK